MSATLLSVSIVVFIAILFYMLEKAHRKRKVRAIFGSREDMPLKEWYEKFCRDDGFDEHLVYEVCKLIGEKYRVPPGKLRPTDRFGEEFFKSIWPIDDALSEISDYLALKAKETGLSWKPDKVDTLYDYFDMLNKAKSKKVTSD